MNSSDGSVIYEKNILSLADQLSYEPLRLSDIESLKKKARLKKPDGVVIVGMGGSGIAGTILQNLSLYGIVKLPVVSWRDFNIPAAPFKNPLIIFVSFSGNTRETLSGFEKASRYPLKAVVTTGGKLLFWAERKKLPRAVFDPAELPPRQATGHLFYAVCALIRTLYPSLKVPDLRSTVVPEQFAETGKKLARLFKKKVAIIYTSGQLAHLGQIWKININETGKALGFANTFPEINHNELTMFESRPKDVEVVFLTTEAEQQSLAKELMIIRKIMNEERASFQTVTIPGASAVEITFNGLALAQWIGFYLAQLQGQNPLSTKTVDTIKKLV